MGAWSLTAVEVAPLRRFASLLLLTALAALAVSCGDKSDTVSTQPVDTTPVDTTPIDTVAPATTLPPASTTTTPQITTTTAMPARVAAIWAIPDGIEVAVAGEDGDGGAAAHGPTSTCC